MNIFYLSNDPIQSAQWMVDKHVVKMILESAQLLSTAHRVLDGTEQAGLSLSGRKKKSWVLGDARDNLMYQATHINHPSAIWARQAVENYAWLVDHMFALMQEYTYRYGRRHKVETDGLGYLLQSPPYNLRDYEFTTPPSAMAPEYILGEDPVINYRNYYKQGKVHLHKWTKRDKPDWM